jgi:hypothetical protein
VQRALAAVLADPWGDAPRERFADEVQGVDPERAAFIRDQLDIVRQRRAAGVRRKDIESDALGASLAGLANGERWSNGILPLFGPPSPGTKPWRYRRGFVEEVTLPAAHFLKIASALYARAPILDLVLKDVRPVAAQLFASPHLSRIRSLSLANSGLGDAELGILTHSRHLGRLRWLSLYFNAITDEGVEALARAKSALPALRFVRLDGNPCRDPNPWVEEEDGRVYGVHPSARGEELMERHGSLPWIGENPSSEAPDPETFA